jgi:UDP-N-acetylglucosamine--N-acetylmuramyl-(pentapeptide) pyrophosphoryl-undecaprenol N-acetylglucosamine transferase
MKIILSGGGSGGPVSPVLAVAEQIRKLKSQAKFLFIGTRTGPERKMVTEAGMEYRWVPAARWRRFWSIKNLFSPFWLILGILKSLWLVYKFRPSVMFSAGGFVAVPVAWASWLCGAKIIIHQQDAQIGLANKLIRPFASCITASFEQTAKNFAGGSGLPGDRAKAVAEWVGNPVRPEVTRKNDSAMKFFGLHGDLTILLVLGGATGAVQINKLVEELLPELVKSFQVIHQTGKGKNRIKLKDTNYHPIELIGFNEYTSALQLADLVISRAGLSSIAELSALGKTAIVIPMPFTHQEANAQILLRANAAAVLMRKQVTKENVLKILNVLKFDPKASPLLSNNISKLMPHDAAVRIAELIAQHERK